MKKVLAVGFGGMAGSLLRMIVFQFAGAGPGLWLVNILGSFIIGIAAARLVKRSAETRLFVSTGLVGSFTSFSAFSADWFHLLESSLLTGIIYALGMTSASIVAAALGLLAGRKGAVE
ncbi:CrcB family protein [Planococcus sp. CP5-4]|uniref:fluoride efflux transporter FluC n=1 Tax=unclassified Planococcus (in: firmicutes) TaxID=2662419 RepID=UPI001C25110D|nr:MULTISPECIES: CrcB family protein [unclassified Planococcus (in: firmicutes)]MBU9672327.1 CrcB family protein [Planococcus sp. CP5-4_YE]MBV0909378.1 CrcB family protein [Planococcus sp. CP5-4_UN]MBW6064107.1 CrcB family protein [Planococcus sp. CP5-4]